MGKAFSPQTLVDSWHHSLCCAMTSTLSNTNGQQLISKVNINNHLRTNKRKVRWKCVYTFEKQFPFIFHFIYIYLSIIYCHINPFQCLCFLAAISQTKSLCTRRLVSFRRSSNTDGNVRRNIYWKSLFFCLIKTNNNLIVLTKCWMANLCFKIKWHSVLL